MRCTFWTILAISVSSFSSRADDFKLEPGFTLLLNGKNLDGWKTKTGNESLDGKSKAYKGRFTVTDGALVIDPSVKGDVRIVTAREFSGDVHIMYEGDPDLLVQTGCSPRGKALVANQDAVLEDDGDDTPEILIALEPLALDTVPSSRVFVVGGDVSFYAFLGGSQVWRQNRGTGALRTQSLS